MKEREIEKHQITLERNKKQALAKAKRETKRKEEYKNIKRNQKKTHKKKTKYIKQQQLTYFA